MLSEKGCKKRTDRLWKALPEETEWVLVSDQRHVNYFSAFWVNPLSQSLGERAFLLLEREGRRTLFCDNGVYKSRTEDPFIDDLVKDPWYDQHHSVDNRDYALFRTLSDSKPTILDKPGIIEEEWFPLAAREFLPYVAGTAGSTDGKGVQRLGEVIRKLRRCKEEDEIELIRQCVRGADAGNLKGLDVVQPGKSELEIYREVQAAVVEELGCPVLVYGDFRGATPDEPRKGGPPTDYRLQPGDTCILDFAVVLHGYRSDTTTTIPVGPATEDLKNLFTRCEEALAQAEKHLNPSTPARDIHRAIAELLNLPGKPALFPHHAGHGIGMGHPEPPILVAESTDTLEAGDVIAVEPGAYAPGIGGVRLEHNYLITASGFEKLSTHGFQL